MDQNQVSTKGSSAPNTNAGTTSDLWKQVVARQLDQNAELKQSAQALATTQALEPAPASAHTFGVPALADTSITAKHADRTMPLDVRGFPHPPKGSGQYLMPTLENFQHMLQGYEVHVAYDVIKKRLVVLIPDHQGSIDNHESVALAVVNSLATLHGMPIGQIPAMLIALGDRKLRNAAADWIMSRPWDGVDRLPEFYATIKERKGYPPKLKKILLRRWLLSAVAAVLKAYGFHCRGVLVLQGKQGIGKTAFFIALVPDAALRDLVVLLGHHLDGASKDSMTTAITHWIVELGELDGTLKKDIARLKGFVTADTDKIRRPYGRSDSEYPRRTVFGASVNDPNFLVDATGNSRFWTIAAESINYEHGIDMQQLFAQLAVEFQAGEQWWLTKEEEEQLAEVNKSHFAVSLVRESLMAVIDLEPPANGAIKRLTAIETLKEAGIDRPTTGQCKEAASILRELYGDPKKVQGRYVWRVALVNRRANDAALPAFDDDDLY
jgi:putative DNA primase/helicase